MTNNEWLLAMSEMMDEKLVGIKDDIQDMKGDIQNMKGDIQNMKCDILNMKGEIITIKGELHLVKLCQENMILPRLNTIESCYTDTYTRYKEYADKMDSTFSDVDLLKRVVAEQSKKSRNWHNFLEIKSALPESFLWAISKSLSY